MRSIRRTLVVSLVLLFTAALAVVAGVLDRIAAQSLDARERVSAESIETDYLERHREEHDKLDQQLLNDARTLSTQMQNLYAQRFDVELRKVNTAFSIGDRLLAADPWVRGVRDAANARWNIYFSYVRNYFTQLHLDDSFGTADGDHDPSAENQNRFFQINIASRTDSVWRSRSLGDASFPPRPWSDTEQLTDWRYDDVTVHGTAVRRVVFRTPIILPWVGRPGPPGPRPAARSQGRGDRSDADRPPSPPPVGPMPPVPGPTTPAQLVAGFPRISLHCARPVSSINAQLADHRHRSDQELEQLHAAIRAERFALRATVVGIGAAALATILVGGMWVVRRGLSPLDRLSDAVSLVSARDFRLPIGREEMSRELAPIHDRLTHALDELKRAFEREKQAVADISHELRTPVAALLTTMEVSLRKPRTADQYRQTLDECRTITKQLGQLVERVMTLAYLDAGQTVLKPTAVEAGELIEGCAAVIRPLAEAHGVTFRVKSTTEPVELHTDRDKLREVLMNLLHNAVEYSDRGGTVELAVGAANGHVEFAVTDTGIGMTDEVKGRIFERFYRADPSRTETGVHAGLGLAIVKEYVERLGGHIRVESAPGQGSTFAVELPA